MKKIELPPRGLETLFGVHDQNIKYLESLLAVRIDARGQDVSIDGDPADVEGFDGQAARRRMRRDFSEEAVAALVRQRFDAIRSRNRLGVLRRVAQDA